MSPFPLRRVSAVAGGYRRRGAQAPHVAGIGNGCNVAILGRSGETPRGQRAAVDEHLAALSGQDRAAPPILLGFF